MTIEKERSSSKNFRSYISQQNQVRENCLTVEKFWWVLKKLVISGKDHHCHYHRNSQLITNLEWLILTLRKRILSFRRRQRYDYAYRGN